MNRKGLAGVCCLTTACKSNMQVLGKAHPGQPQHCQVAVLVAKKPHGMGQPGARLCQGDASRRCMGLPNARSKALPGCDNSLLSTLGCAAWFAAAISLHPKGCSPQAQAMK